MREREIRLPSLPHLGGLLYIVQVGLHDLQRLQDICVLTYRLHFKKLNKLLRLGRGVQGCQQTVPVKLIVL